MKFLKFAIVIAAFKPALLLAGSGAGFYFSPAAFYSQDGNETKTTTSSSDTETTTLILNASFGYAVGNGVLIGGKYYNEKVETEYESPSGIGKSKVDVQALGPAIGYDFGAFKLMATFFLLSDPKRTEKGGGRTVYSEGDGEIYDALYMFNVGSVGVGPQLSLIHLTYDRQEVDGNEVSSFRSRSDTHLLPSVALWITF